MMSFSFVSIGQVDQSSLPQAYEMKEKGKKEGFDSKSFLPNWGIYPIISDPLVSGCARACQGASSFTKCMQDCV